MIVRPKVEQELADDGFSSEEEFRQQMIYKHERVESPRCPILNQQTKRMLPPPGQIRQKSYSLHPDITTGWIPKFQLPEPIPLQFSHYYCDQLTNYILRRGSEYPLVKLCYMGPRYSTTFFSWYQKPFEFPYKHINAPKNWKFTNRFFCGQHCDAQTKDYLQFDSLIESGNLDLAFRLGERQYELFLRVDSNTRGHLQWYNFTVRNMVKGEAYQFCISNFQKGGILYTRGMKPYVFSRQKCAETREGWAQGCSSVKYQRKVPKVARITKFQQEAKYFRLSFTYHCEYDADTVQFAYCIPYPFSKLNSYIKSLQEKSRGRQILKVSKLCTSLGGLEIPLLTITSKVAQQVEAKKTNRRIKEKKVVIASGRTHPGQPNGSFMIEGFVSWLCGQSRTAEFLRENIVFKIVPMLNVDGVSIGNYRTSLSGKDMNRQFISPDKLIFPEIHAVKKLVREYRQLYRNNFEIFLDFHGHSVKKNVFMYGPEFPITHKNYYDCRIFPKLISMKTEMFRYHSCSFKVSEMKQSTARAVIFKQYNIPFTYTIQASKGSFYNRDSLKDIRFCDKKWIQLGEFILEALKDYLQIVFDEEESKIQKRNQRRLASQKRDALKQEKAKQHAKILKVNKRFLKTSEGFAFNKELNSSNLLPARKNEQLRLLIEEIKNDNELKDNRNQDDQISEGSSDCEPSDDDLDSDQMSSLIEAIKSKKCAVKLFKRLVRQPGTQTEVQIRQKKGKTNNLYPIEDQYSFQGALFRPLSSPKNSDKRHLKKHIFMKKKNSINTSLSLSPQKQDSGKHARITTFNFCLTKINMQNRKRLPTEKKPSASNIPWEQPFIDPAADEVKKLNMPPNDLQLSEAFRRTFISVNKDSLKRDGKKFYTEISTDLELSAYKMSDIRGRRIKYHY